MRQAATFIFVSTSKWPNNKNTGANAGGPRQLSMRTRWAARVRSVPSLGGLTIMQRRRTFVYAVAIIVLVIALSTALLPVPSAGPPQLGFGILRYTNQATQVRALVEVTNASRHEFRWRLFTEIPSNHGWVVSGPEPDFQEYIEIMPSAGTRRFWITVPPGAPEWRLRCHLWQKMGPAERRIDSLLYKVGLRWPFHTTFKMAKPDVVVSSPGFYRLTAQPGGPANGSQPIRAETNRTSSASAPDGLRRDESAAGSRR